MMYLDLSELNTVFKKRWFWSSERSTLAWFRREDHFGDPSISLEQSVKDLVEEQTGQRPSGPIRLLTHLRYFGYCFNPVSFYYCFDEKDSKVETIVAEVSNTPWGERHCYVLSEKMNLDKTTRKKYQLEKIFHVSPFMPMAVDYDWRFSEPGQNLSLHMQNYQKINDGGEKIFDATLTMEKQAITARSLANILWVFPFMTGKVVYGIYLEALKMWLRRFPFYDHPKLSQPNANNMEAP